jgi:hypothetical protein
MPPRRVTLILAAGLSLLTMLNARTARASDPNRSLDFARDVQPILSDNCYSCHGHDANKRKADLRLDALDPKLGPFAPRDGYSIIAPGKPDDSVLVARITSDDPEFHMPPPEANRHLTDQQIALLKQWIEQGAKWGRHWSLEPPRRLDLPEVSDANWCRNAIDRFVLARLDVEQLKPSPEAPKETLIRRVTLDLTGLPPTAQEVDAFLADTSPDAYEKLVDRLLASARYGEHMAWTWLDLARYADTNGYQADPTRTMWPWRDWVVSALNDNMPFDQFVTWQLAGDLLPEATRDQRLASGFNRNHPYNGEGGRIADETRVENVMDRVDTLGTAFLGLTVGCARCHDHKFDPISQREYYQLFAYFNQCSETGEGKYVTQGNVAPTIDFATAEQIEKLALLRKSAKEAADRLAAETPGIDAKLAEWETAARYEKGWIVATPVSASSAGGATMRTLADSSVLVAGENPETDVHEVVLRTDLPRVTGIRLEVLPDESLAFGGPGRSLDTGNLVLTNLECTAVSIATPDRTKKLAFANADATFAQDGFPASAAIDGDPKSGWAVYKSPDKNSLSATFRFAEPAAFDGATASGIELHLRLHYESQYKRHTAGRFRLAVTDGSAPTPEIAANLAIAPEQRSEAQKKQIREFYLSRVSTEFKPLSDDAAAAKKAAEDFDNALTKVMVMDDATPRQTHVLTKGAYDKPAERVDAGVLAILNPLPALWADQKNNRLTLAQWLFAAENPLSARLAVNRAWQQFFGVGIVKTVDDFGVQGERPANPELLDWLAVQFRESGWDIKALHRLIVTSAAYRQSSKVTAELLERDPENRLLARGPRLRLPSQVIRDQALAASGLLVEKLGGPPVKSYQPPGVWEEATFGQIKYEQDHGEALYRRSLYMFWRRIVGPTEFFDAASRTQCTVRQSRTNTPLHALTTLNDTTYIEAARGLAQRILTSGAESPEKRLTLAYRLVVCREPNQQEQTILLAALGRLKREYTADPAAAQKLLAVGESKRNEKVNAVEHAAYTAVCLEILNLDEALTKE